MHGGAGKLVPDEWRAVINPWTRDEHLARVLILRSAILWSYSHVEQRLADIMIRCSHCEAYQHVAETPPFTQSRRVRFLRDVLALPGPLADWRSIGVAILDRYEAGRAIRNRMAHAHMSVLPHFVRFDEIVLHNGVITQHITRYLDGQLEKEAAKAARFSRAVQRLHYRLVGDDPLPDGEGQPIPLRDRRPLAGLGGVD